MDKVVQGGLSIVILLSAGQCVSSVPTGEELFEQQVESRVISEPPIEMAFPSDLFVPYAAPEAVI
jgi:hypothetical protein